MASAFPHSRPSDWLNLLLDSWWYRTELILSKKYSGSRVFLNLDGINYRANVFMNGQLIAGKSEVCGTYRRFSFDVTGIAVAVQVFRPADKELALTWVDWAPTPPDKNMGLWHGVSLKTCGNVRISDMHVSTELASNDKVFIRIRANLQNLGRSYIKGKLVLRVDGISVSSEVNLAPGEKREMLLDETSHLDLVFNNPRL